MRRYCVLFCCLLMLAACSSRQAGPLAEGGISADNTPLEYALKKEAKPAFGRGVIVVRKDILGHEHAYYVQFASAGEELPPLDIPDDELNSDFDFSDEDLNAPYEEEQGPFNGTKRSEDSRFYAVNPVADPLEGFNRAMFGFNNFVYDYVFDPPLFVYKVVTPKPLRIGIYNFFRNLGYPIRLVSNLLQGRPDNMWRETQRFGLNTLFGMFGLFEVSKEYPELDLPYEDTGRALASWGVGHGAYLVLPILGPSSVRDFPASFVDGYLNPVAYIQPLVWDRIAVRALQYGNQFTFVQDEYNELRRSAIDPYTSMKDFYIQFRARKDLYRPNTDGNGTTPELPKTF